MKIYVISWFIFKNEGFVGIFVLLDIILDTSYSNLLTFWFSIIII